MEGDQGSSTLSDEPQADSAAASDSFSQLWTDVMGMLVSFYLGGRGNTVIDRHHRLTTNREFSPLILKVDTDLPIEWLCSQLHGACKSPIKTTRVRPYRSTVQIQQHFACGRGFRWVGCWLLLRRLDLNEKRTRVTIWYVKNRSSIFLLPCSVAALHLV